MLRYDLAPGEKRCCEFQDEGLRQRWFGKLFSRPVGLG